LTYNRSVAESNPFRWVVLSAVAAGAFAIGLVVFINHKVDAAKAQAAAEASRDVERIEAHAAPLVESTAAVAAPFIAHVGAGRFAEAHALLAAPYRRAVSVADFAAACRASPVLSGSRAVTLREVRQQRAGSASTLEARGVLDTNQGGVPVDFVFLVEPDGPRVLTVSLAGVPVLQGVTAAPR
jgi:hypothetical protein